MLCVCVTLEVACRCSQTCWQTCLQSRRSSFSAWRGELHSVIRQRLAVAFFDQVTEIFLGHVKAYLLTQLANSSRKSWLGLIAGASGALLLQATDWDVMWLTNCCTS